MSYQYHDRFLRHNQKVKQIIKPPEGFDETFIESINFEWSPDTNELMFCWVYVKDSQELWLLREGQWLVYPCEPSQIGQMFADGVEKMHQFNYYAAKGCGVMVEQVALCQLRLGRDRGTIH